MPLIFTHFFNYALKLYAINNVHVEVTLLTLVASTPILNTITRIFCDSQLKKKFTCKRKVAEGGELIESFLDNENSKKKMNDTRQSNK